MSVKISETIKNNKIKIVLIGFFLFACFYYLWFFFLSGDVFMTHSKNEFNRKSLVSIRNDLHLGDDYKKVLENFWSKENDDTDLNISVFSSERWLISMPAEFGATDWRMYVEFEEGKVIGYRIRTSDGPKPKDAPEDVGKTNE